MKMSHQGNLKKMIIAAALLYALPEMLRALNTYRMVIYAVILIVIMLVSNNEYLRVRMQMLRTRMKKKGAEADE
jgi:branched-chain amino acid transport system permease protein